MLFGQGVYAKVLNQAHVDIFRGDTLTVYS